MYNLKIGETFNINGFDIVAVAQVAAGGGPPDREEVLVLSNNSTHYLVAWRALKATTATLDASFRYFDNEASVAKAYGSALQLMTHLALIH